MKRRPVSADPPTLSISLTDTARPAGEVVLTNEGKDAIRIWRGGNDWGDGTLSFVVSRGDDATTVTLVAQDYTRNVPSSLEVTAGGSHRFAFDLGDGSWEPVAVFAGLPDGDARLTAVFEITATPESIEHGVWTGQVRSDPAALG